jgi:hypothetical protein
MLSFDEAVEVALNSASSEEEFRTAAEFLAEHQSEIEFWNGADRLPERLTSVLARWVDLLDPRSPRCSSNFCHDLRLAHKFGKLLRHCADALPMMQRRLAEIHADPAGYDCPALLAALPPCGGLNDVVNVLKNHPVFYERRAAVAAMLHNGPNEAAFPALVEALSDRAAEVRSYAALALVQLLIELGDSYFGNPFLRALLKRMSCDEAARSSAWSEFLFDCRQNRYPCSDLGHLGRGESDPQVRSMVVELLHDLIDKNPYVVEVAELQSLGAMAAVVKVHRHRLLAWANQVETGWLAPEVFVDNLARYAADDAERVKTAMSDLLIHANPKVSAGAHEAFERLRKNDAKPGSGM